MHHISHVPQHSLCKASTATCPPQAQGSLPCCFIRHPLPLLWPGDTQLYADYLWNQENSLKRTEFQHPGDDFGCLLIAGEALTPSLSFHQQGEYTLPFSRIKKPETVDCIGYTPSATLHASSGINISVLPLYRISTLSIGSCFLAAALR